MVTNNAVKVQRETLAVDMPVRLKRIGAGCLDLIIVSCIQIWVSSVFGTIDPSGSKYLVDGNGISGVGTRAATMETWWLYIIVFIYFFVQEALFRTTIGKRLLGLQVVEIHGRRLTLMAALIRNLVRFLDALPFFYIVGLVSGTISPSFQRVGDRFARTTVMPIKSTPYASYSWNVMLRNYLAVCALILVFVAFCLKYSYYDRPPLVVEGWKNINNSYVSNVADSTNSGPKATIPPCGKMEQDSGDYQLNRYIQLISLGQPQWNKDTITYHIVYADKKRCNALVTLRWRGFFDGGWAIDHMEIQSV